MILQKTATFFVLRSLLLLGLISCSDKAAGQQSSIDTAHSKLMIHVSKSGLFSGFADNHEVEASIAKGSVDAKSGQIRLSVDSRQMRVLDPQLSSDKRQQVQERMLGPEVLDSIRFPEITFESTRVEREHEGSTRVDGLLSLHGVRKPISVLVHVENGRYTGKFAMRQRDFAITPVSIAGGTVKVKDELVIEFDIHTGSSGNGS